MLLLDVIKKSIIHGGILFHGRIIYLRFLFNTTYQDISSGSRLVRKEILKKIKIDTHSPFLGAELTIKAKQLGFRVSEVGIHYYPTNFRSGSSVSLKNILLTIIDMLNLYVKLCIKKK